ncbi:hypothetical protein VNO77_44367 [Canavalia gladiata]|uniref:Uncharacterized protein n=1 Tax=Canavalia gladiata TaxID=3824 RepID=A0AAN9JWY1_CANGL
MTTVRSNSTIVFIIAFLLLTASSPSQSLSFSSYFRYRDLLSLSHSLLISVANNRAARGDIAGADRARTIANRLEQGTVLGFWKLVWSSWTWSWTGMPLAELYGAISDMNEFLRGLTEFTRLESVAERSAWVSENYQNILAVFKSLSRKLLKGFGQSGVVREVVETLQKEVVEGGLIRDCLEVGNKDLKALIQIIKDLLLQFFPVHDDKNPDL